MLEFEQIVKSAFWIVTSLILLLITARLLFFIKTRKKRVWISEEYLIFKIFRIATMFALPVFLMGVISYLLVVQKGSMFATWWMKSVLVFGLVCLVSFEFYYNIRILRKNSSRIMNIFFFLVLGTIGGYLTKTFLSARNYPSLEESAIIEIPFEGRWVATGAGATGLTNHHNRIESQKYAIDLAKFGSNNKLFTGLGIDKEESNTYGSDVLSPVNGVVAWVVDTLPDHPVKDKEKLAGNHITIRFQDSLYVALAHLQPKSINKKIGDIVEIGEPIGKVGMSGNTDICHLHIHVQDTPQYDLRNSKTYPIRFTEFRKKRFLFWRKVKNDYVIGNDIMTK